MLDEENCSPSSVGAVRRAERMVDMHINQFYAAVHTPQQLWDPTMREVSRHPA
jgi:hypothetical protein